MRKAKIKTTGSLIAVAYARYSSNNQRDESIDAQLRAIREYCLKNKVELTEVYTDEAISGKNDHRDNFQRMINAIISGEVVADTILVHKFNRFARNKYDSAIYKKKLKDKGVRVISVTQNIEDTPEGELMEGFLEVMDEYYSANLSIEVKKGLRENALKGQFVGGRVLMGYDINSDGFYTINEHAPTVRRIFEEYASGLSRAKICDKLNNEGLRNQNGGLFKIRTIGDMLRNEKYIGNFVYAISHDETIRLDGIIPPIIDDELWHRVQAQHNEPVKKRANKVNTYHLTGKSFCEHCGCPISAGGGGKRLASGERLWYYECVGKSSHKNGCPSSKINKKWLETAVVKAVVDATMDEALLRRIAELSYKQIKALSGASSESINAIKKELAQIAEEQSRLAKLYLKGKIDDKVLDSETEDIAKRKYHAENQLAQIETSRTASEITEEYIYQYVYDFIQDIKEKHNEFNNDFVQAIVSTFVERVVIGLETVEITLKLDFPTISLDGGDKWRLAGAIRRLTPLTKKQVIYRANLKQHYNNYIASFGK